MRIGATYSHQGAEETMIVRRPTLWREIQQVIEEVDATKLKTKVSKERTSSGRMLYSPVEMNKAFKKGFAALGWEERRQQFWVTSDSTLTQSIYEQTPEDQKAAIENAGLPPLMSYNQTDFVKERVAVEVQFGKYSFVAHDIFVKHQTFFAANAIDIAIEIVPMKELEAQMSSGVPYYERDLMNLIRNGRGIPNFPLVLIGIAP